MSSKMSSLVLSSLSLSLLAASGSAAAATWSVDLDGNGDAASLQEAIELAADGDTILLPAGSFGAVRIEDRVLEIIADSSTGPSIITGMDVRGADTELRLVGISFDATSGPLEIRESKVDIFRASFEGDGVRRFLPALTILEAAEVSLADSRLADWLVEGDLVSVLGSKLIVSGSVFSSNASKRGSVIGADGSLIEVRRSKFEDNDGLSGSSISIREGMLSVSRSDFVRGSAMDSGAHILAESTELVALSDARFIGGLSEVSGGSVSLVDVADARMLNCDFTANMSMNGGAVAVLGTTSLRGAELRFRENQAERGGHMDIDGADADLVRVRMFRGVASYGGAISLTDGNLTVSNLIASGHETAIKGAALYQEGGFMDVAFSVFDRNQAAIGSVLFARSGVTHFGTSIVVGNESEAAIVNDGEASITVWSSLLNDENPLMGDISADSSIGNRDPLFIDAKRGNYILRLGSPAIDAVFANDLRDLDGTVADMGAFGGPGAWPLRDADGDGFVIGRDCDDSSADVNESAEEIWYDGVDSDCAEDDDFDQDHDGWSVDEDLDDTNSAIGRDNRLGRPAALGAGIPRR